MEPLQQNADLVADILQGIAVQVTQSADALAAVCGSEQLTYWCLAGRANQLAHHLQTLGVGPETIVGICMERSLEAIVAILGVLKAGGAFVPIDPTYPAERIALMLADAEVTIMLTQDQVRSQVSRQAPHVVSIDGDWPLIARRPRTDPAASTAPGRIAYVIYTSGSTGVPKGVLISHGSLVRHCVAIMSYYELRPTDRVLQFTSLSFDPAIEQIGTTLLAGATLVMREATLWTPVELQQVLAAARVTVANLPPAYWQQAVHAWAAQSPSVRLDALRLVISGGDVLPAAALQLWQQLPLAARLLNAYGPTETTITATAFEVPRPYVPSDVSSGVPIGRPLGDRALYILDQAGQPVPDGVSGELYISGATLARGYHRRPDLTAARFVPDPLGAVPGARLYRTGDLVRRLADGNIAFLGRADDQVKVRGFRIELQEIEAVLGQAQGIRAAAATVYADSQGEGRLVAFVVPEAPETAIEGLHAWAQRQLPAHMVPAQIIALDRLPLTPSGKIDRRLLPAPAETRSALRQDYAPPRTGLEVRLAAIWAEVLAVDSIGIHDNLFDLGGHSLKATQIASRIRQSLHVDLTVDSLFERPTISDLAELVERTRGLNEPNRVPLTPIARSTAIPLSFAQQRLWFLDQLAPGNPAYNIPAALRLAGKLNIAALKRSLGTIVMRHEALRTAFVDHAGQPFQVIAPTRACDEAIWPLPLIDLSALPADTREAVALRTASEEARRSFDLTRGSLLRTMLLRLGVMEHILLLVVHHIVSDGWSIGVFFRELGVLYNSIVADAPAMLPELPVHYADFAVWQRQWLQGPVLEDQLAYWRGQLLGAPTTLDLPLDRPRPHMQTFSGATYAFALSSRLADGLATISRQASATLFMTLLTAFQIVLGRYSGQEDIVAGSPIAGRTCAEVEDLIGFFVNTLALRADLSGAPTFRTLLQQVREVALGAYAHQDIPFELVVDAVRPERHLSYTPLFQVMFALQDAPKYDHPLAGLRVEPIALHNGTTQFDLVLFMFEQNGRISGLFENNTDLFDETTIARMAGHFQRLLAGIVANPDSPISALPLLTANEHRQISIEWNATTAAYPCDRLVHQLFEAQAARAPEALAIACGGIRLTYAELNTRANQLARHLRRLGVGPETLVVVCIERTPDLVIALLSILKAGGAYLPLDPAYPQERLAFMLRDARASILLTATDQRTTTNGRQGDQETSRQADKQREITSPHVYPLSSILYPPSSSWAVVDLVADWPAIAQENAENLVSVTTPNHLAYVIYTSGSTGRPKGVMIEHGALLNLVYWHQRTFNVSPSDRSTLVASPAFDASVWEQWPYLIAGASLHIPDEATRAAPDRLHKWLLAEAISMTFLPTPLAEAVLALEWPAAAALGLMLTGGDKLRVFPLPSVPFTLVNNYGPTENTVVTTSGPVPTSDRASDVPDIGRPIANTQVYLLDRCMNLIPAGVVGELYVGGDSLARGYLNRPELTAERFVPNPFLKDEGGRMKDEEERFILHPSSLRLYKTGDLARHRPDGKIEILGRIDHQIKIRGFRIELGEIEAALTEHPQLREAVVVVREDTTGGRRLVAYVVPANDQRPTTNDQRSTTNDQRPTTDHRPPTTDDDRLPSAQRLAPSAQQRTTDNRQLARELCTFLQQKLPDYMVPVAFVALPVLPISPNGKVDRKALPAPPAAPVEADTLLVLPHTPIEEMVVATWVEVLKVAQVGVHTNFFALGGHSLLAAQVVGRLRETFQVDITLRSFFEAPTVSHLVASIATAMAQKHHLEELPLRPVSRLQPLPLSFAQEARLQRDQVTPRPDLITHAFRLRGPLDVGALERSLTTIVERHEVLRTTFRLAQGMPSQQIEPPKPVPLSLIDLNGIAAERAVRAQEIIAQEVQRAFDLAVDLLLRSMLIRLDSVEHILVLTTEHIVADAWSVTVLFNELRALYAAYRAGMPAPLAPLPIQYADFVYWQRKWIAEALLEGQFAFWRRQLADGFPEVRLPGSPTPSTRIGVSHIQSLTCTPELSRDLITSSRQHKVSLFILLLAMYKVLLHRHSGQVTIALLSPTANRSRTQTQGLIGWFAHMLILATNLDGNPTLLELVQRVREVTIDAYLHQDVPFIKLMEVVFPEYDRARLLANMVDFHLSNGQDEILELADLQVESMEIAGEVNIFGFSMRCVDQNGVLSFYLAHDPQRIPDARVIDMLRQYQMLLTTVVSDPHCRLADVLAIMACDSRTSLS